MKVTFSKHDCGITFSENIMVFTCLMLCLLTADSLKSHRPWLRLATNWCSVFVKRLQETERSLNVVDSVKTSEYTVGLVELGQGELGQDWFDWSVNLRNWHSSVSHSWTTTNLPRTKWEKFFTSLCLQIPVQRNSAR